jgi:dephospho-CoA kinase
VLLVGLSGSLGSGKSTVGRALAARGAAVIDADRVARDVLAPGSPGAQAVLERFGPGIRAPDGSIDRAALAAVVFADPAQRVVLEAISHPLVHKEVSRRVDDLGDAIIVVEIPLLDAARRDQYGLDVVVLVEVQPDIAVRRAVGRGMAEGDARARIAAQPSAAQRRQVADRILGNDGTRADLEAAVDELWDWLQAQKPAALSPPS